MKKSAAILFSLVMAAACDSLGPAPAEEPSKSFDNVMICYFAAFNNLATSTYILGNLEDLERSRWIPKINDRKALLAYIHTPDGYYTSSAATPSHLIRFYSNRQGQTVRDTLWSSDAMTAASGDALREAVNYVTGHFESDHYGMVLSSHGTGWMPQGSYDTEPTGSGGWEWFSLSRGRKPCTSFGHEWIGGDEYFIDIDELAASIPVHLDYLIFDACLMGGVETAYELRKCTDLIGFSQCEVMGAGFRYSTMPERLLWRSPADPMAVLEDAFSYYDAAGGSSRTSVVSLVDCSGMDRLASECAPLFEKYRDRIAAVDPDKVQGYFSSDYHWFYDLEDILVQSGIPDGELSGFREAMDSCVLYKAATPKILGSVNVRTHCGMSMYLPCNGSANLDDFYRTLAWNEATGLVK